MSGEKVLHKLIQSMSPTLRDEQFVFCCLPISSPYALDELSPIGTFQEQEGLTVIVEKDIADTHRLEYSAVFKCITLSVHSSLDAVGLTAAVASKLAQHNISANVVAAFYHDHIFVNIKDAEEAIEALKQLAKTQSD